MSVVGPRPSHFCSICGAPVRRDSTFCARCGQVLDVPRGPIGVVFCRECGAEVSLGDAHCVSCGASQPARAVGPAQPAAPVEQESAELPARSPVVAQIVWFLCIGIWLSLLIVEFAWLFTITFIGRPIGRWLLSQLSMAIALRPSRRLAALAAPADRRLSYSPSMAGRIATRQRGRRGGRRSLEVIEDDWVDVPEQLPFGTRAIYFGFVGFWFSLVWLMIAWLLAVMTIPMPVAEWMFDQLPAVTTLERR